MAELYLKFIEKQLKLKRIMVMLVTTEELNKGLLNDLAKENKKYWQEVNVLKDDIFQRYSNLSNDQVCYTLTINPNRKISKDSLGKINTKIFSRLKSHTMKNLTYRDLFQGFITYEKSKYEGYYHMHYILAFPLKREDWIVKKLPLIIPHYISSASVNFRRIELNEDKKNWIKYITKDFNPHAFNEQWDFLNKNMLSI